MKKTDKTLQRLLSGRADHNIDFSDLIALLKAEGFAGRQAKAAMSFSPSQACRSTSLCKPMRAKQKPTKCGRFV